MNKIISSRYMLMLSICCWIAAFATSVQAQRVKASEEREHPLSIVIEEYVFLDHHLEVDFPENLEGKAVKVQMVGGRAQFLSDNDRTIQGLVRQGQFILPRILPGPVDDESILTLEANGFVDHWRIATVPTGHLTRLQEMLGADNPAFVFRGVGYAVIDEEMMSLTLEQMQTGWQHTVRQSLGDRVSMRLETEIGSEKALDITCGSLCSRLALGPGLVKWQVLDPWGSFQYSVKPEVSNSLVPATPPQQAIDGVYRRPWGCDIAYKVPDSCTMEVFGPDAMECCCNAAMYLIGHKCKLVFPSTLGWPECPL